MNKLLELNQVSLIVRKEERLTNINLSISSGEKIALIGKSGAGKSSLISIANGSIKPSAGEVKWQGKAIQFAQQRNHINIATIWQEQRLIEELNVQQNINVGALGKRNIIWAFRNLIGNIETNICKLYLKEIGLEESLLNYNLSRLSGGQRQRIAIARSLRQQSDLILADEPLLSLDPNTAKSMLELILNKRDCYPILIPDTCLVSLHQPDLIKNFNRVIGIKKGKLILDIPANRFGENESKLFYEN